MILITFNNLKVKSNILRDRKEQLSFDPHRPEGSYDVLVYNFKIIKRICLTMMTGLNTVIIRKI